MSQPHRQSLWEVGVDFGLGATANLGIQAVLLKTFTLSRGIGFSAVFLLLALARRYSIRRGFNRLLRPGQRQPWRLSLLETCTDTACAMAISLALLPLWYPSEPLPRLHGFIGMSYLLTPLSRFILRRCFELPHLNTTSIPIPWLRANDGKSRSRQRQIRGEARMDSRSTNRWSNNR